MFCGYFVIKSSACFALVFLWLVNSDIHAFEFSSIHFIREWPGSIGNTHFTIKFVHFNDGQFIKAGYVSNKDFLVLLLDVMALNLWKYTDVILNTFLFRLTHLMIFGACIPRWSFFATPIFDACKAYLTNFSFTC